MEKDRNKSIQQQHNTQPIRYRGLVVGVLTFALVGVAGIVSSVAMANNSAAKSACSATKAKASEADFASYSGGACCPSESAAQAKAVAGEKESKDCDKQAEDCDKQAEDCDKQAEDCDKQAEADKAGYGDNGDKANQAAQAKATCPVTGAVQAALAKKEECSAKANQAKLAKDTCSDKSECPEEALTPVAERDYVTFAKVASFFGRMGTQEPMATLTQADGRDLARAASSETETDATSAADRGCCLSK